VRCVVCVVIVSGLLGLILLGGFIGGRDEAVQLPMTLAKLQGAASTVHAHLERDENQLYFSGPVSEQVAISVVAQRAVDLGVTADAQAVLPEYYLGAPEWWKPVGRSVSLRRRDTTESGIVDTTHYLHECFWFDNRSGKLFWWQSSAIGHE